MGIRLLLKTEMWISIDNVSIYLSIMNGAMHFVTGKGTMGKNRWVNRTLANLPCLDV